MSMCWGQTDSTLDMVTATDVIIAAVTFTVTAMPTVTLYTLNVLEHFICMLFHILILFNFYHGHGHGNTRFAQYQGYHLIFIFTQVCHKIGNTKQTLPVNQVFIHNFACSRSSSLWQPHWILFQVRRDPPATQPRHKSKVQLDWTSSINTQKSIYQQTRRATTVPRPPLESSWQGESKSALTIFVKLIFDLFSK